MAKTSSVALVGAERFLQKMLYGAETEDLHPTGWRNRQSSPKRTALVLRPLTSGTQAAAPNLMSVSWFESVVNDKPVAHPSPSINAQSILFHRLTENCSAKVFIQGDLRPKSSFHSI
jgi:hypothetical protein